jgi:hypothetical protein
MEQKSRSHLLRDLIINIALPSLVLMKLSDDSLLGPLYGLLLALSFPLGYGLWEWVQSKKLNFFAGIGLLNVGLTGGLGLMKADGIWFAIKEAAVPLVFAIGILGSLKSRTPIVRSLLLNEKVVNVPVITRRLNERQNVSRFEMLMAQSTVLLAGSFFLSAVLNFTLAQVLLKSPAGTAEFNKELGQMTSLSFPVIAVPCTIVTACALWWLMRGIRQLTGLTFEEIFHEHRANGAGAATVEQPREQPQEEHSR